MESKRKIISVRKVHANKGSYFFTIPKDWAVAHGIDGDSLVKCYVDKQEPEILIIKKGEDRDE